MQAALGDCRLREVYHAGSPLDRRHAHAFARKPWLCALVRAGV